MVKGMNPGADRTSVLQREVRRRPVVTPRILIPATEAKVRRAACARLYSGKGNYSRVDSFMFADDVTGVISRVGNLILTCFL